MCFCPTGRKCKKLAKKDSKGSLETQGGTFKGNRKDILEGRTQNTGGKGSH